MFRLELLPKTTLEKIDSPSGYRLYKTPVGNLPSVTTILSKISDKTQLNEWRERIGHKAAEGVSTQAKGRGNAVHALCEKYLLNEEVKGDVIAMESFRGIKAVLEEFVSIVYGAEFTLWSEILWTAGTCDAFVQLSNGMNCIIDFKTLRRVPKEDSEKIKHYKIQTTTYAMMFEERYNVKIPYCLVICSVDHDNPAIFPFRNDYYRNEVLDIFSKPL